MAKITHYSIGDVWTPQATFTVGNVNTDPTTLTVRLQDAAGAETILLNAVAVSGLTGASTPVAKTATGIFKLNPGVALAASGYWYVRFEGTGTAAATDEFQAVVDPSEFTADSGVSTRALVGLSETKDWLQQQNIDVSNDLDLVRVINDMSDRFQQEAEREIKPNGTNPSTRTFEIASTGAPAPWYVDGAYVGDRNLLRKTVRVGDLTSYTTVQIIDTNWTTVLETVAGANITARPLIRRPWEPIRELEFLSTVTALTAGMRVTVNGTWGFPLVPGNVRQAVLDAITATMDRDVEHYRQDLGVEAGGGGTTTVMVAGGAQRMLSMPRETLAVAWSFRDNNVG